MHVINDLSNKIHWDVFYESFYISSDTFYKNIMKINRFKLLENFLSRIRKKKGKKWKLEAFILIYVISVIVLTQRDIKSQSIINESEHKINNNNLTFITHKSLNNSLKEKKEREWEKIRKRSFGSISFFLINIIFPRQSTEKLLLIKKKNFLFDSYLFLSYSL